MSNPNCSKCGALDTVKRGKRYNQSKSKQLYRCNECHSTFVEPDGFERMRHSPEEITRAVHMHNDGMSLFKTKNHLWQHDGVKITRKTVSDWTKKYSLFLKSNTQIGKAKAQRTATL